MTRMSLVRLKLLRMIDQTARPSSPHAAIRVFVVALAVTGGQRSVPAASPGLQAEQQLITDQSSAPLAPTLNAERAQSLTPIRRVGDAHDNPGDRTRTSSLTSSLALMGLILGGAYIALNWMRRRQDVRSVQTQAIDLLSSRRLDGQSTLHLVRIGRRVLAVGSSSGGTRTLAVIEDAEEIAQLMSAAGDGGISESPAVWRPFHRRKLPANLNAGAGSSANQAPVILGGPGRPA